MIINHNLMAMNTHRQMGVTQGKVSKSMERLSSGMRINRAGDDAAGLAISEKMRSQIRGLKQASRNAQDGISLIQTGEGALNETHQILQRMRELSVQSANDTNTAEDRSEIQEEIGQLRNEIDRIASSTEFNGKKLLNGAIGTKVSDGSQVGSVEATSTTKQGTYTADVSGATMATSASDTVTTSSGDTVNQAGTLTINDVDVNVAGTDTIQDVIDKINTSVSGVSASMNDDDDTLTIKTTDVGADANLTISADKDAILVAGDVYNGTPVDTDGTNASGLTAGNFGDSLIYEGNTVTVAGGDADGLTFEIKDNSADTTITVNGSLNLQIGSNSNQDIGISLDSTDSNSLGIQNIDVTSVNGANNTVDAIDDAISTVSSLRSKIGAYQNRLEHTIKNVDTSAENLQAAESRIRDVDMAKEMMNLTKENILQQAAQAMLAQANQAPQGVLQLLR